MPTELKTSIQSALQAIPVSDFRSGHLALLKELGYASDKSMPIPGADPTKFVEMVEANTGKQLNSAKALLKEWTKADILFQLTDEELSGQKSLFDATEIKPGLLQSYLFFAIELSGATYTRTALSDITRQLNRLFPMPVMILFSYNGTLSIAVINRRANKREQYKDVLGKVTLIHGIDLADPHRGHLEILESFSVPALTTKKRPIDSFDSLHAAWEEIFNVELLNKKFYRELSNWYFWAMRHCHFPLLDETADRYFLFKDKEKVREHEAKNLIRLLTRILFVWFIKQKHLVPDAFFDPDALAADFLEGFDPNSTDTRYYKAILQNLFFASLNQTHGKREFRKSGQHQNTTTLLRYENELKKPQAFIDAVEQITPFLNGGLFDCLDYPHATKKGPQGGAVIVYEDGFSDRKDNPLVMPDFLFFGSPTTVNLSDDYGDKKRSDESVRGLIHILNGYKFTIVENTPIEQEIALDPELLGQVFENLLASYNEETKTTARKQTGSFYTPRSIVDYMVDESLKAHLLQALTNGGSSTGSTADTKETQRKLDELFTYNDKPNPFSDEQTDALIRAIDACKILDPACGSGAFPMGALQKLVYILGKLDPRDELWEQRQLAKVDRLVEAAQDFDDATFRERAIADAEAQRADIEEAFAKNELGYGRKLYLIENCLYGVDIQSIATQVSKLRFFISLIVDQTVDKSRDNFGVRPLPNLETKFVTADTLIQIEKPRSQGELFELAEVSQLQKELKRVRHDLFSAKTPRTKRKYREQDAELRAAIAEELKQNGWASDAADKLAAWDPYDQNASAPYFDPEWMFGLVGFDVVIGNPPWGASLSKQQKVKLKYDYPEIDSSTPNSFAYFIGAALRQSLHSIAFVLPDSILIKDYARMRQLIAPNLTEISWYLNTGVSEAYRQFVYVEHDVCVLILNQQRSSSTCKIRKQFYDFEERKTLIESYQQLKSHFIFKKHEYCFNLLIRDRERVILEQLDQHSQLEEITQCHEGIHTGNSRDILFHGSEVNSHCKPLFYGGRAGDEIHNYYSKRSKWFVDYRTSIIDKEKGYYASLRDERIFTQPKIYITRTGNPIKAFYDFDNYASNNFFSLQISDYSKNDEKTLKAILPLILSSLANYYIRTFAAPRLGNTYIETKIIHLKRIPVSDVLLNMGDLFLPLTNLMIAATKGAFSTQKELLFDLIDACVMECYFRDHMAERDLLFHDTVAEALKDYQPDAPEAEQLTYLETLEARLKAAGIPERLARIPTASPDLLGVILKEGKV